MCCVINHGISIFTWSYFRRCNRWLIPCAPTWAPELETYRYGEIFQTMQVFPAIAVQSWIIRYPMKHAYSLCFSRRYEYLTALLVLRVLQWSWMISYINCVSRPVMNLHVLFGKYFNARIFKFDIFIAHESDFSYDINWMLSRPLQQIAPLWPNI